MMVPNSYGRCAMRVDPGPYRHVLRALLSVVLLSLPGACAWSAEAPGAGSEPPPVSVAAEASYQDLRDDSDAGKSLDEAIFTEISTLTIPEIGIALPEDQDL